MKYLITHDQRNLLLNVLEDAECWRTRDMVEALKPIEPLTQGVSLRDYFALAAMEGMISAPQGDDNTVMYLSDGLSFQKGLRGRIAVAAYAMADEMIKAKEAT